MEGLGQKCYVYENGRIETSCLGKYMILEVDFVQSLVARLDNLDHRVRLLEAEKGEKGESSSDVREGD